MAMDMALLVPGQTTVDAWQTLGDIIDWSRVDDNIAKSLLMELGDVNCQSIPLFAMTDPESMRRLLVTLQIATEGGPRKVTHFEKARLNLLYAGAGFRMN